MDISKKDLQKEIAKILKNANLATTSTKKVIQKLQESFGTDLSDKKKIIDQLVMDYVNSKESESEKDDDDDEEDEDEEEKKPVKRSAPASKASKKSRKESSDDEDEDKASDDDKASDESESDEDSKKKSSGRKGKKRKKSAGDSDSDWGKKKEKAPKAKKSGGGGKGKGGYTRAYKLSPALAELMGQEEMPRHEVVKRVWALVKERKLYDPNNKQFAICDDAMYKVFGTKRFRIFGMMKHLKSHFCD